MAIPFRKEEDFPNIGRNGVYQEIENGNVLNGINLPVSQSTQDTNLEEFSLGNWEEPISASINSVQTLNPIASKESTEA